QRLASSRHSAACARNPSVLGSEGSRSKRLRGARKFIVMGISTTSHLACKLVRSLHSRCDCDHKKGVFYDWAALPVLRAKITFSKWVRPRWRAKPCLQAGLFSCDLLPDGRGAAWPYTRSGCSWHFAAQGPRLSRLAGVAARGRAVSRSPVHPSASWSRAVLFSRQ